MVKAKIRLTNYEDEILARRGIIKEEQIRKVEKETKVDTAATMLTLPEEIVEELGLTKTRQVTAIYADGRGEKRPVVRGVLVEINGRDGLFEAVVGQRGTHILIGQVVLEILDFIVDVKKGIITPRPESPDIPLIEIL